MSGDEEKTWPSLEDVVKAREILERDRERQESEAVNTPRVQLAIVLFDLFHSKIDMRGEWDLFKEEKSWINFSANSSRPVWLKRADALLSRFDGDLEAAIKAAGSIRETVFDVYR